jgi:ABC-type nitrate/sulfonate/bicarbonate transport system substrate-binding protein
MKKPCLLIVLSAFVFYSLPGWTAEILRISHSAIRGRQAVLFVTRDAGFFKEYDLGPQIVYVSGTPPSIAGLVSGEFEFTVFGAEARSKPRRRSQKVCRTAFLENWVRGHSSSGCIVDKDRR